MERATLEFRARCIREIRRFFEEAGYLEVDTPVIADKIIPEPTIELLSTTVHGIDDGPGNTVFLLPSPELYMKRLLAGGSGSIFQLSRCFRDREPASRLHNPEFLMLEWYTVGADYIGSIETAETLLGRLCERCDIPEETASYLLPPFSRITVDEAFRQFAGIDLASLEEPEALREAARKLSLAPASDAEWPELFHLIMVSHVEPNLKRDRPVLLIDYPAQVSCLAKRKTGACRRERWELYLRGTEIANCFTEAVSAGEVDAYFREEGAKLDALGRRSQTDESFPRIYRAGHPVCSGAAMGVDRLLMVLSGSESIAHVMPFPIKTGDAQAKAI